MTFWLPKPWATFAGPECTQVQPQQWMNIPWAGSCLHFSHECLQGIIIAVRVGRFGVELLPGGGILCGDVGQFHIAGILLLILKVPEKKIWTTAQSARGSQHWAVILVESRYPCGLQKSGWAQEKMLRFVYLLFIVLVFFTVFCYILFIYLFLYLFLYLFIHVKSSKWWQGK